MNTHPHATHVSRHSSRQRGVSLLEVLVAVTIFTIVMIAALMLYERSQRAYMSTDANSTLQQNVRFAMDRLVTSIRDAGTNVNATGERKRTDEQIEGAWESAIFVRGDFDGTREADREGTDATQFRLVSTGNDEIVGYVLTKPGANTKTITLNLDLLDAGGGVKRDAGFDPTDSTKVLREETRTLNVAALSVADQTNPPYRLERITFDPTNGNVRSEVVADDIFRMQFAYTDKDGAALAASTLDGTDANRGNRRAIRRVSVALTGMTNRPDPEYRDSTTYTPAVPADLAYHRKLTLREEVWAANLGLKGRVVGGRPVPVLDPPSYIQACAGNCNTIILSWQPVEGISTYMLHVTSADPPAVNLYLPISGTSNKFNTFETPPTTRQYTFEVAAVDDQNNVGTYSQPVTLAAFEGSGNKPKAITSAAAAQQDGTNLAMNVTWQGVTENEQALVNTCVVAGAGGSTSLAPPNDTALVDLQTYEVHRVRGAAGADFTANASNRIDDKSLAGLVNVPPQSATQFVDRLAAPCEDYFYKVVPRDRCSNAGAASPPMAAAAKFDVSGLKPAVPADVPTASSGTLAGASYNMKIAWTPVTKTTTGVDAAVARYKVRRERQVKGLGIWTLDGSTEVVIGSPAAAHELVETVPASSGAQEFVYRYTVSAYWACGIESDPSTPYVYPCAPTGTVTIASPAGGTEFDPGASVTINVAVTDSWNGCDIQVVDAQGAVVHTASSAANITNGSYTFAWDTTNASDGTYRIEASARQGSCFLAAAPVNVVLSTPLQCFSFVSATLTNSFKNLYLTVKNSCQTTQVIRATTLKWNDVPFSNNPLKLIHRGAAPVVVYDGGNGDPSGVKNTFNMNGSQISVNAGATAVLQFEYGKELSKLGQTVTFSSIVLHTSDTPAGEEILTAPLNP